MSAITSMQTVVAHQTVLANMRHTSQPDIGLWLEVMTPVVIIGIALYLWQFVGTIISTESGNG